MLYSVFQEEKPVFRSGKYSKWKMNMEVSVTVVQTSHLQMEFTYGMY
jgi:hypothetical protein